MLQMLLLQTLHAFSLQGIRVAELSLQTCAWKQGTHFSQIFSHCWRSWKMIPWAASFAHQSQLLITKRFCHKLMFCNSGRHSAVWRWDRPYTSFGNRLLAKPATGQSSNSSASPASWAAAVAKVAVRNTGRALKHMFAMQCIVWMPLGTQGLCWVERHTSDKAVLMHWLPDALAGCTAVSSRKKAYTWTSIWHDS